MYVVRLRRSGPRRQLDPRRTRGDPHRAPARRPVARPAPPPPRHGARRRHPLQRRPAAPPGCPRGARPAAANARQAPLPCPAAGPRHRRPRARHAAGRLRRRAAPLRTGGLTLGDVEHVPDNGLLLTVAPLEDRPARPGPARRSLGQPDRARVLPGRRARRLARASPHRPGPRLDRQRNRRGPSDRCSAPSPRPAGSPASRCPTRRWRGWSSKPPPTPGSTPSGYSGHSLRRGLLTAGGENQAQLADLMRQSRHRSAAGRARLPRTRRSLAQQCHRGSVSRAARQRAAPETDGEAGIDVTAWAPCPVRSAFTPQSLQGPRLARTPSTSRAGRDLPWTPTIPIFD